jgi:hypothetical protein
MPIKVDVFHSRLEALLQPQPGTIQKRYDHPHRPAYVIENVPNFVAAEDDWHAMRHSGAWHLIDRA